MRIGVIGTGYVGLVTGACFAEFGFDVVCCDIDTDKIQSLKDGNIPLYEPGLAALVEKQKDAGRLHFTTETKDAVTNTDAVFLAVGTPPSENQLHVDMQHVYAAAKQVAEHLDNYTVIVTKSTVPIGTAREIETLIKKTNPDADFDICANPEFLREGSAIADFKKPDRVVIGTHSEKAQDIMRTIYRPLYHSDTPIVITTPETAEIIKYASNAFLATKITFINEIANLCEKTGADVKHAAMGIGLDKRIGGEFLRPGPGFGGSCFPKDTMALTRMGQMHGAPQNLIETVVWVNAERQRSMANRILEACGDNVTGKRIGILGVSFKPNTDDVRESPALSIIPLLQEEGAHIAAYDPAAMDNAAQILEDVEWCDNAYTAAKDADALVVLTEWNEFRGLDLDRLANIMAEKRLIDLRNIYKITDVKKRGFHYISVGRPEIKLAPTIIKDTGT